MKELLQKIEKEYDITVKFKLGITPLGDEAIEIISYYNPDYDISFLSVAITETGESYVKIKAIHKETKEQQEFTQCSEDYIEAFDNKDIETFLNTLLTNPLNYE